VITKGKKHISAFCWGGLRGRSERTSEEKSGKKKGSEDAPEKKGKRAWGGLPFGGGREEKPEERASKGQGVTTKGVRDAEPKRI